MSHRYINGVLLAFETLKKDFQYVSGTEDIVAVMNRPSVGSGVYWYVGRRSLLKSCLVTPPEGAEPARDNSAWVYEYIATIGMTPVPACCGAFLLHGAGICRNYRISPDERKEAKNSLATFRAVEHQGLGKLLMQWGLRAAKLSGYTMIQAITNGDMKYADYILKLNGFKPTFDVVSTRTQHRLQQWCKDLRGMEVPNVVGITADKESIDVAARAQLGY